MGTPPDGQQNRNFVRLRGLPYAATVQEIRNFFGTEINVLDVYIVNNIEGKPSGEAYVLLDNSDDVKAALQKDQESMGRRYIEVFTIGEVETDQVLRRMERRAAVANQGTIRVRGLPFSCSSDDIRNFFKGLNVVEIVFGKEPGGGRATGEAYLRFESKGDAERAIQLNGQYMGKRYLEIYNVDGGTFETFKDSMNASPSDSDRPRPLAEIGSSPWSSNYGAPPQRRQEYPGYGNYPSYPGYQGRGYGAYDESYPGRHGRQQGPPHSMNGPPRNGYNPQSTYQPYGGSYDPMSNTRGPSSYGGQGYSDYRYGPPPNNPYAQHHYDNRYHDYPSYSANRGGINATGENLTPAKIHMRGLPYRVTSQEIEQFFSPLKCVDIKIGSLEDGRASGDGIVEFESEKDANEALARDRQSIKSRYIELFSHDNAKISRKTSYRSILNRGNGGYNHRSQGGGPPPKSLFTGSSWWESV